MVVAGPPQPQPLEFPLVPGNVLGPLLLVGAESDHFSAVRRGKTRASRARLTGSDRLLAAMPWCLLGLLLALVCPWRGAGMPVMTLDVQGVRAIAAHLAE